MGAAWGEVRWRGLLFELGLDEVGEGGVEVFVFEFGEDLLEEAEDEELVGFFGVDAAGFEVEFLFGLDAGGGGAVGAPDVVGLDFEAGQAVGLGDVGEHEVAVFLVGVGFLGVGFDDDEAGEDGFGGVEEDVFVEEVGSGLGGGVGLEGALVELLDAVGDGEGEHLGVGAGAEETGVGFVAGLATAEVEVEGIDAGVAVGGDGVGLEGEGIAGPLLGADVGEVGAGAGVEVVDAGDELVGGGVAGDEVFDEGGLGVFFEDDEGVGEAGLVGAGEGVLEDERLGDFDALGDVEEGTGGGESGVKGDEFFRAEVGGVFLEPGADEIGVIAEGFVEGEEEDALGGEVGGDGGAADDLAVREDDLGDVGEVGEVGDVLSGVFGEFEAGEVEAFEGGEAPSLVGAGREGEGVEFLPGGVFGRDPPGGEVGALGEVGFEAGLVEAGGERGGGSEGGGHAGRK